MPPHTEGDGESTSRTRTACLASDLQIRTRGRNTKGRSCDIFFETAPTTRGTDEGREVRPQPVQHLENSHLRRESHAERGGLGHTVHHGKAGVQQRARSL